ncbi:MAG: ribonuclease P protein component [Thiolinea sp.]
MAVFPRKNRLTRPDEFRRVFQRGRHRRFQSSGFTLRVRESTQPHPRLGLALSKRALKRAVDRNRIKRLVRESFRTHFSSLPALDIVVLGQSELASLTNAVILQQLGMLWGSLREFYAADRHPPSKSQTPPD